MVVLISFDYRVLKLKTLGKETLYPLNLLAWADCGLTNPVSDRFLSLVTLARVVLGFLAFVLQGGNQGHKLGVAKVPNTGAKDSESFSMLKISQTRFRLLEALFQHPPRSSRPCCWLLDVMITPL